MKPGPVVRFPIEKEYEKNKTIGPNDIKALREWLNRQPHLPSDTITDVELLLCFHCCEQSAEVSKQVLDLHYTLRTLFPFFSNRLCDKKIEHALCTELIMPLEKWSVNGYRGIYARLLDTDPRNFVFADAVKAFMMIYDLWQQDEGTWPGFVILIDMDQTVVGHLARLDIMTIRQILYFLQEAMFIRLKELHFLNAPSFMDKLMMMLKPFMKKELMDMIHIHQVGANTLDKFYDKDAFPEKKDYNRERDKVIDKLKANEEYFKEESKNRVQENLRPGKPKTIGEIFGIEGSFKKLDID